MASSTDTVDKALIYHVCMQTRVGGCLGGTPDKRLSKTPLSLRNKQISTLGNSTLEHIVGAVFTVPITYVDGGGEPDLIFYDVRGKQTQEAFVLTSTT